ncbi:MAG: hypothetical protein K2Y23_08045 [Cyanobacteria bacterium]|nr:hypothetical protein [Cyanobacteriota bacterium]
MTHLTPDELIDAMEGVLAADRQAHLATCEECRRQVEELASVLHDAKRVSVPEPSPLFWPHFSERVRVAIDQDAAAGTNWPAWLRWQVLLPLGAMAMLILGLMMTIPIDNDVRDAGQLTESAPHQAESESWGAVADLVGQLDVETASAAGVIEPGVAELAVLELTAEEQQELTRLLQAELTRAKS